MQKSAYFFCKMEQYQIDQGIRLKKLIKALHLNQSSFAESIGKTQPNINRMISGNSNISGEILNRISGRYAQVNLHWLLTGVGEMFLESGPEEHPQVNEDVIPYKDKEMLEKWMEEVEEILRGLVKKFEKRSILK